MKIRIKRANTERPIPRLESGRLYFVAQLPLWDYIDELIQQAIWNAEKCQRES